MHNGLPIGDFSRATHLSVKTLRYYHRVGLLEPAEVDPDTGYRRYTTRRSRRRRSSGGSVTWTCRWTRSGRCWPHRTLTPATSSSRPT